MTPTFAAVSLVVCLTLPARAQVVVAKSKAASPPAVAAPAAASTTPIDYDSPAHKHYFRYQKYLAGKGLSGETRETWLLLTAAMQNQKVAAGELFLKDRFQELMTKTWLSFEDKELLQAVWGEEMVQAVQAVSTARSLNDPEQIKLAIGKVNELSKTLGNVNLDWKAIFDGRRPGEKQVVDASPTGKDYLAPEKVAGFMEKLASPEVQKVVATEKSFGAFLQTRSLARDIAPEAVPSLMAMYQVLTRAPEKERAELAHILPTLVQLINDGKKVTLEEMRGALGFAVPGPYDRPLRLAITPAVKNADPLVVGEVLTHELQHIYDMYTGRYYTLDSELRSFKTGILYQQALAQAAPERHRQIQNSDDDMTRRLVRRTSEQAAALARSPADFAQSVAFGSGYSQWEEGVFMGRVPLREVVDPVLGAPRELAAIRALRQQTKTRIQELERRQEDIRAQRERTPSRELDKELEKVTVDLEGARYTFNSYDSDATIKEIRLRRMQSEVEWLDKSSRGGKEPYDLHLAVDKDYVTP